MRFLLTILALVYTMQLYGQACQLPTSIGIMKPEKCGIRYVDSEEDQINVILEFEKKARIITPENPTDAKGNSVNLRGVYHLTYDKDGNLTSEQRSFVQNGEIPEKGLIFGLNGQRGDLIDYDLNLISVGAYDSLPWVAGVRKQIVKKEKAPSPDVFFETDLLINKQSRITDLQVTKYIRSADATKFEPITQSYGLEMYDSSSNKSYWTNLYLPVTDPISGTTIAMLNHFDRKKSKEISKQRWRLVAFDSLGRDSVTYEWNFNLPMKVAFRLEKRMRDDDPLAALDKQIWAFKPMTKTPAGYTDYQYYELDAQANVVNTCNITSKIDVFDTFHHLWVEKGVIYVSNQDHQLTFCFIDDKGQSKVSWANGRLEGLEKLINSRLKQGKHAITLDLSHDPERFDDGSILLTYQVQENVGVGASFGMLDGTGNNVVNHGLVIAHIQSDGTVLAAKYYSRPSNAVPKAKVVVGPIARNDQGHISFYASETTSVGKYPVLFSIKYGNVSIMKNDQGATASRFVYFDSDEGIVSYFGVVKDPEDPRNSVRTVEVLHDAD